MNTNANNRSNRIAAIAKRFFRPIIELKTEPSPTVVSPPIASPASPRRAGRDMHRVGPMPSFPFERPPNYQSAPPLPPREKSNPVPRDIPQPTLGLNAPSYIVFSQSARHTPAPRSNANAGDVGLSTTRHTSASRSSVNLSAGQHTPSNVGFTRHAVASKSSVNLSTVRRTADSQSSANLSTARHAVPTQSNVGLNTSRHTVVSQSDLNQNTARHTVVSPSDLNQNTARHTVVPQPDFDLKTTRKASRAKPRSHSFSSTSPNVLMTIDEREQAKQEKMRAFEDLLRGNEPTVKMSLTPRLVC